VVAARSRHGLDRRTAPGDGDAASGEYLTAEQLLELAWKVAGATMAALGVPQDDLPAFGNRIAPIINDLVQECGVTIPESYRR
jgi:hypothetical protein